MSGRGIPAIWERGSDFQELGHHPLFDPYGQPWNCHGVCVCVIYFADTLKWMYSEVPGLVEVHLSINSCLNEHWGTDCLTSPIPERFSTTSILRTTGKESVWLPMDNVSGLYVYGNISAQFSSVAQSCLTVCNTMDWSTPGFPVHHQLLELAQTHVQWVNKHIDT